MICPTYTPIHPSDAHLRLLGEVVAVIMPQHHPGDKERHHPRERQGLGERVGAPGAEEEEGDFVLGEAAEARVLAAVVFWVGGGDSVVELVRGRRLN